jgi:pyruvate/2-oxoglutarate dehydrogenase complex dihydrolipoamide acyltransferase (E2) component
MPHIPIIMPQLGESIAEATILEFLVKPGDTVSVGQDLIEVETNKATMNVSAPCPGRIQKFICNTGDSYPVGAVLGQIEASAEDAARLGVQPVQPSARAEESISHQPSVEPTVRGLPVPANLAGASYMSARMKARIAELGLNAADLAALPGSGAGGRVTIQDFERFLSGLEQLQLTKASSMRVAVADAMRRSWTRPLATVGLVVNMDPVLEHRKKLSPKPGPTLYALRALGIALAKNSAAGGRLIGQKIVHPSAIDVGFAVEAEDGVLVPVIRNADRRPLRELVEPYNEMLELARQRKLAAHMTGGSIATVTNYGTFGLIWATPIPLPEQTLVLGLGAGRRAPSWDEKKEQFVPVTEAQLTLSFDHRVLDGGAAGRLLQHIVALMLKPEEL